MTSCKNNWLAPWIAIGLLLGVGFVFPALWWLGIVGIAATIYVNYIEDSFKHAAVGVITAWTIKSALAISWSWAVYPIEWLAVDLGNLELLLILVWWGTASLWLGLGGLVFVLGARALVRYTSVPIFFIAVPFLWVLSEMVGSLFFSIMTMGAGGTITTALSFGYVGYLLAQHNLLIHFAQIAGVYSLGVLVVCMASATAWVWLKKPQYKTYVYAAFVLLVGSSFIVVSQPEPKDNPIDSYVVAIVETDFSVGELRSESGRKILQTKIESAVNAALELEPDYILLPEDSRYFNQQISIEIAAAQFSFLNNKQPVIIVDSGRADENEAAVVQSFVYNGKTGSVDQSHKRYLVPQGEFMPSLYESGLRLFGREEVIDQVVKNIAFEVGSKTSQSDFAVSSPGVLFCFESVSPWGVKQIIDERGTVPFIAHPVSHAWFNQPQLLWQQLDSMLRVQAIWNEQYIVSAGNAVSSQVISPVGIITQPDTVVSGEGWILKTTIIPKT